MLSIPHLVVIFIVALIVFGPEKLPQLARVLGKAMADFRRVTTDFRTQIEDEMREMERQSRLRQAAEPQQIPPPPQTVSTDAQLLGAPPVEAPGETPSGEKPPDGHSQPA
jgi:sec-independent protein translocase protein TatB